MLLLSGCTAVNFQERMYGTWVTKHKISLPNSQYESEFEYLVFFKSGKYQTNIFGHLFVEGTYVVKQDDSDYFVQLEYKRNTTILQVTFQDQNYDVLKIKNSEGIITVFQKEDV